MVQLIGVAPASVQVLVRQAVSVAAEANKNALQIEEEKSGDRKRKTGCVPFRGMLRVEGLKLLRK